MENATQIEPGFINLENIELSLPKEVRCWLIFTKSVYHYTMKEPLPAFVRSYGVQVRLCSKNGVREDDSDFASTPPPMWSVPGFDPARFVMPAIVHDGLYKDHACELSIDNGQTWVRTTVERSWCDDLLAEMIEYAPNPGNMWERFCYRLGVGLGGGFCW